MEDIPMLLNELTAYVEEKFAQTDYFGDPIRDIKVTIECDHSAESLYFLMQASQNGEKKTLMRKLIQFLVNKQDLVNDSDIEKEYLHAMRKELQSYFTNKFAVDVTDNILLHNSYVVSAATHQGIAERLHSLAHAISLLPPLQLYEQMEVVEQEQPPLLTDITETEEAILEQ
jgi:hypothetical protein